MNKFKCTITKTTEYEIEIDESVWTNEALKNWSSVFEDVESQQELAEVLAQRMEDHCPGEFIEGFGKPNFKGKKTGNSKDSNDSINIVSISEDIDVDSEEVLEF